MTLLSTLTARAASHEESLKKTPMPRHEVLIHQELSTLYGVLLLMTDDAVWASKNVEHQRAASKLLLARTEHAA